MRAASAAPLVRPMAESDVPQVATVTAEAFATDIGSARLRGNWEHRLRHSLVTDPGGSFVSEGRGMVTGAAQAVIRDGLWILSLMAVSPTLGVGGEGRGLMDATLAYGSGTEGGLIIASDDPRALRLYASSGFALEPTFKATGPIDQTLLPASHPAIASVDPEHLSTLGPISRAVRGATHTPDLEVARFAGSSFYRLDDRGFVVVYPGRGIWMLAARDEQAGAALFWHALAQLRHEPQVDIGWISGHQQWALDVCLAARLSFTTYGAIRCAPGLSRSAAPLHPEPAVCVSAPSDSSQPAGRSLAVGHAFLEAGSFDRPKISLRAGLVAAIPVATMMALGTAAGSPPAAVATGVGAMLAGVAWRAGDGPIVPPVGTMVGASAALATAALAGMLSGRWPWLHLLLLAIFCLIAGLATSLGRRGNVVGTQSLIGFVVFGRFPEDLPQALALAGLVLAGGLAQTGFATLVAVPFAWRRQRDALAAAYWSLADFTAQLGASSLQLATALEAADRVPGRRRHCSLIPTDTRWATWWAKGAASASS